MDSLGFRLPQYPSQPPASIVKKETDREINATKTVPAPDSRFEAYAAPLEDGRLVTDYRPSCATRAPPGTQFAVKQWTIHNAEEIARVSRKRHAELTGHVLGTAATEMPFALTQDCTPYQCHIQPTQVGIAGGIGIERMDVAPELFGTFTFAPSASLLAQNKTHTELNRQVLGGRNTPTRYTHLYA
jgi:hypothetical protein